MLQIISFPNACVQLTFAHMPVGLCVFEKILLKVHLSRTTHDFLNHCLHSAFYFPRAASLCITQTFKTYFPFPFFSLFIL